MPCNRSRVPVGVQVNWPYEFVSYSAGAYEISQVNIQAPRDKYEKRLAEPYVCCYIFYVHRLGLSR